MHNYSYDHQHMAIHTGSYEALFQRQLPNTSFSFPVVYQSVSGPMMGGSPICLNDTPLACQMETKPEMTNLSNLKLDQSLLDSFCFCTDSISGACSSKTQNPASVRAVNSSMGGSQYNFCT